MLLYLLLGRHRQQHQCHEVKHEHLPFEVYRQRPRLLILTNSNPFLSPLRMILLKKIAYMCKHIHT